MNMYETKKNGIAFVESNGNGVEKSYAAWINDLKRRYREPQIKAAIAVNSALRKFYWTLGRDICGKCPGEKRNIGLFNNLSNGFCLVKIPCGHHIVVIGKSKGDSDKAIFYVHVRKTIENGWSRTDLQETINERLYQKAGKTLTNFTGSQPIPDGYLAKEFIKNEYSLASTETIDNNSKHDIEQLLMRNITRTLRGLGGGFAYIGHQVRVNIGGEYCGSDLIFYHLKSRRYLAIKLKVVNFKPEHIGQLGFYMVAVDSQLKNEWNVPTVRLVLGRGGNKTVIGHALIVTDKPMGVARYRLTQKTPKELSSMKHAVTRLGSVVDATIADAKRQASAAQNLRILSRQ